MIRIGLIGCGSIGEADADILAARDDVVLRAFCDTDPARARMFAGRYGSGYATADAHEVLRDPSVDAVYICTQTDSHATLGRAAAGSGKHIMMEKPLALTLEDCERLSAAVRQAGVVFLTGFKLRYEPLVEQARTLITAPLLSIGQLADARWPDGFWGNDPVRGGGNVLSQGCHIADLLLHMQGSEPLQVSAMAGNLHHSGLPIVDTLTASVSFVNGSFGTIVVADCGRNPVLSKFSLQMYDGTRSVHLTKGLQQLTLDDGTTTHITDGSRECGMENETAEFLTCVRSGQQPRSGLPEGIRALRVLFAAVCSASTGRTEQV
jgi:predicted dehydrogenase